MVVNKYGWEQVWLGTSMVGSKYGWEQVWLGASMVGNKYGWEQVWLGGGKCPKQDKVEKGHPWEKKMKNIYENII